MNLQSLGTHVIGAAFVLSSIGVAHAQVATATHVAAEMTKGKLNPAQSKPGDQIVVRLKDDVRSNGQVVLKKGTNLSGIVRNVSQDESKSMIEIEWLVPAPEIRAVKQLSIALQSIRQVSPMQEQSETFANDFTATQAASFGPTTRMPLQSNLALLSMPSVVAADHDTTSAIESSLASSSSGQLFKTGRGEMMMSGSKQSVELFSHLNNDTVIASQSTNFEISSGAQMQFLVGVNKK